MRGFSQAAISFGVNIQVEGKDSEKAAKMTKKNRPPLLKYPTWPDNQLSDGNSDNSIDEYTHGVKEASSISKLDSPSFYSVAAIDFSAISHLSEEHDKQMAQENAEKSQNKHTYISDSTKEKLYGKATQRRTQAKNKKGDDLYGAPGGTLVASVGNGTKSGKNRKSAYGKPRKPSKSESSSIEKTLRKRYSSSPAVTVSSTPISSIQSDDNVTSVIIESHPLPSSESGIVDENEEENTKQAPAEKQPLPPEGFKISRYPLKTKSQNAKATSQSLAMQISESSLYRLIAELRKQLHRAEEKMTEAENQAREWKEIAVRTLQAVEVIESQIEAKKAASAVLDNNEVSQVTVRRVLVRKDSNDQKLDGADEVIQKSPNKEEIERFLLGDYSDENVNVRKRPLPNEEHSDAKKQCKTPLKSAARFSTFDDEKNKSLLAWLASSEPEAKEIDDIACADQSENHHHVLEQTTENITPVSDINRMNSCPVALSSNPPHLSQRSTSHEEVRKALRAKVKTGQQGSPFDENQSEDPDFNTYNKIPLQVQSSLDKFLDSFNISEFDLNYPSNPNNLGSEGTSTPSSIQLPSPSISSPLLGQSHSDSELHLYDGFANLAPDDKSDFFRRASSSENDLIKVLEETDIFSQLESIFDS